MNGQMRIEKYGRYWKVIDGDGVLVCVVVYLKGAKEIVKRLDPESFVEAAFCPPKKSRYISTVTADKSIYKVDTKKGADYRYVR